MPQGAAGRRQFVFASLDNLNFKWKVVIEDPSKIGFCRARSTLNNTNLDMLKYNMLGTSHMLVLFCQTHKNRARLEIAR